MRQVRCATQHPNKAPKTVRKSTLKLLNTYDERDEAEAACIMLTGKKRIASERDDTSTIYNLFGTPSWGNFYRTGMYNLKELENLLKTKINWNSDDITRHSELMATVRTVSKNFSLQIPTHWL